MKKCVVVSDSFKGTLSSREICAIARRVIPAVRPDCEIVTIPVADGGEGTVDCLIEAIGAQPVTVTVSGPYGEPVAATYGRSGELAVIEMAAAAGLPLVGERKNPEKTGTFGVGELMRHAITHGAKEILLGLGGSATNDGGCGAAAAMGVKFYDEAGEAFIPVGGTLGKIRKIDAREAKERLGGVTVTVMCDVDNPLYGERGAACVFAPQKGADAAMVARLDDGLRDYARVLSDSLGADVAAVPGSGAAGGMGAGCIAFFGAQLCSGIDAILDAVRFEDQLTPGTLVITGEGRIDGQSAHGKVISGIARRTKERGVPLVALVGAVGEGADELYSLGLTEIIPINPPDMPYADCVKYARENYEKGLRGFLEKGNAAF